MLKRIVLGKLNTSRRNHLRRTSGSATRPRKSCFFASRCIVTAGLAVAIPVADGIRRSGTEQKKLAVSTRCA